MRKTLLAVAVAAVALVPTLALASGQTMSPVLSSNLSGRAEIPKGDPDGKGLAVLHLNASKGTVCWAFKGVARIGTPNAAHIHKGRARTASGPVVVPLGSRYKATGCTKAAKKLIEAIETHPNNYYVNIHNAKYPAGAIRGQLVAGMVG